MSKDFSAGSVTVKSERAQRFSMEGMTCANRAEAQGNGVFTLRLSSGRLALRLLESHLLLKVLLQIQPWFRPKVAKGGDYMRIV